MASILRIVRLACATLILVAVVVQFLTPDDPWAQAANFFSFFTIQSNLLAAGVLLTVALRGDRPRGRALELARGAVTLYLVITGLVFALLLSNLPEDLQLTLPWVDLALHRVAPIVVAVDWVLDPPRRRIAPRSALLWLSFPAAYVVYTLVRGELVDWYPYPFLDVGEHGYPTVLLGCAGLLVGFTLVALAIAAVGSRGAGPPGAAPASQVRTT